MTPNNAGYYHAAYMAAAAVYVLYAFSIRVRRRAVRARIAALASSAGERS